MSEIKPARTEKEWAAILAEPLEPSGRRRAAQPLLENHEFHAAAAIALQDQPFGFTWEMVDALRDAANPEIWSGEDYDATLIMIANHIAALLPPREK